MEEQLIKEKVLPWNRTPFFLTTNLRTSFPPVPEEDISLKFPRISLAGLGGRELFHRAGRVAVLPIDPKFPPPPLGDCCCSCCCCNAPNLKLPMGCSWILCKVLLVLSIVEEEDEDDEDDCC